MVNRMRDIFHKQRLTPSQLRAVADRRLDDAVYLRQSNRTARANGAIYMGGFAIECLLKALLLERHPNLGRPTDRARLSISDAEVHELLYSHELDAMLLFLPEIEKKLRILGRDRGYSLWERFRAVCEEWTVYVRYSPKQATIAEAHAFLAIIQEVRQWLREP